MLRKEPPPARTRASYHQHPALKVQEAEGSRDRQAGAPPRPFLQPKPGSAPSTCSTSEGRPPGAAGPRAKGSPRPAGLSGPVPVPVKRPIKPSRSELS